MPEEQNGQVISAETSPDKALQAPHKEYSKKKLLIITLTALGVVYGDIGTSPLYAIRECFRGIDHIPVSQGNILGILSLIFWALIIVISLKYCAYVMRADNNGEGGILALMALVNPFNDSSKQKRWLVIFMGVFGASLLYGDGMITPAISVLSAVEGLKTATTVFTPYVIPITIAILIVLFVFQKKGTAGVGSIFGPIMMVWFAVLAILGIYGIIHRPEVLRAVYPGYAVQFFFNNGWAGYIVLGAVFLVVTGGETLFADLGHFGKRPIRLAWYFFVLPSLILNYFGQGALLLKDPTLITQPFYHLAPTWALYPLVILATVATVIASQAVISGAFSLTRQAVLLGQFPRMNIIQTSSEEIGQIYIPSINYALMIAAIALVIGFGSSSNLAAAYGVAVTTTMVITSILAYVVIRELWHWNIVLSVIVTAVFLIIDLAFLGANYLKIPEGGWFPLLIGIGVYIMMSTWRKGRQILGERLRGISKPLDYFQNMITNSKPTRVKGTGVFMSTNPTNTPPMLLHHLNHIKSLHEKLILLSVMINDVPHIKEGDRLKVEDLKGGIFRVIVNYGFMDTPDIPKALKYCEKYGLSIDLNNTTYFVGHQTLIPDETRSGGMATWRDKLFAFMSRNAAQPIILFKIPPKHVVELGIQVEI